VAQRAGTARIGAGKLNAPSAMLHARLHTSSANAPLETRNRVVRGVSLLLDSDLAELYGISTKALLQAVRRVANRELLFMAKRP